MKRKVEAMRDTAIGLAGAAAAASLVRAEAWFLVAVAALSSLAWIVALRHSRIREEFVSQAAFVSIGFLLVWRVTDAWLPVNIAGMWLLTCAADLQRLSARYPAGSPPAHQRKAVRRRLVHLAAVGAATGLVAAVARVADLPLRLPETAPWATANHHLYVVRTPVRDALLAHLRGDGITALLHYPVAAHLQPAWRDAAYGEGSFPVAERACGQVISLPLYPELPEAHLEAVVASIRRFFGA